MDAFYAAVEELDDPTLRGLPIIVGGDLRRGVVSACSYPARRFGVHSALPMAIALQRCPQAVVRRVRMARYQAVSRQVMEIFGRFTDRIEAISIDEAFLDVTGCQRLLGSAAEIATRIRAQVRSEIGLAVSIGIAPNKFVAKLASQKAKPDGLLEILPENLDRFLAPLPIAELWGVGRVTADRLQQLGIFSVGDLRDYSEAQLVAQLGPSGKQLQQLARGVDSRPVQPTEGVKSVSHETTFSYDRPDLAGIEEELHLLCQKVTERMRRYGLRGRRVTLKLKYGDFTAITRSQTLPEGIDNGGDLLAVGRQLLAKTEAGKRPVRLLGIGLSEWEGRAAQQELFAGDDRSSRKRELDRVVDQVNQRFGRGRVGPASLLHRARSTPEEGGDSSDGA
ncbi:DNA polymerase IV [Desulfuromonas sp. DDH964]|nr:DNA polymerase IV [Desulfuromonas sp. DDH964]